MTLTRPRINGIDTDALRQLAEDVASDAARGQVGFEVTTSWRGGTRSDSRVESWRLGGKRRSRRRTRAAGCSAVDMMD